MVWSILYSNLGGLITKSAQGVSIHSIWRLRGCCSTPRNGNLQHGWSFTWRLKFKICLSKLEASYGWTSVCIKRFNKQCNLKKLRTIHSNLFKLASAISRLPINFEPHNRGTDWLGIWDKPGCRFRRHRPTYQSLLPQIQLCIFILALKISTFAAYKTAGFP